MDPWDTWVPKHQPRTEDEQADFDMFSDRHAYDPGCEHCAQEFASTSSAWDRGDYFEDTDDRLTPERRSQRAAKRVDREQKAATYATFNDRRRA